MGEMLPQASDWLNAALRPRDASDRIRASNKHHPAMRKQLGKKLVFAPLPVLILGTYGEDGTPCAMNAAWGAQSDYSRVHVFLGPHKTTENLQARKAFTLSFADAANVVPADYVGIVSGAKVPDKVARAGWHAVKSRKVDAPIFKELPLALECTVEDLIEEDGGYILVGAVQGMSADERILTKGKVDLDKLKPIAFDSAAAAYRTLGPVIAPAFKAGKAIK